MVALGFEPLPREFFTRGELPPRLQLPRAKFEGLCELGADLVGLLRFDARMVAMSAEVFVRTVLVGRLAAREVNGGPEFRVGHRPTGDLCTLPRAGAGPGFTAVTIATVILDGARESRTPRYAARPLGIEYVSTVR